MPATIELHAVLGGLRALVRPCHVTLICGSAKVRQGIERLGRGHRVHGSSGPSDPLWKALRRLLQQHEVQATSPSTGDRAARHSVVTAAAHAAWSAAPTCDDQRGVLLIEVPGAGRPVRWRLQLATTARHGGVIPVGPRGSDATAAWQAVVRGLRQALALGGDAPAAMLVRTNFAALDGRHAAALVDHGGLLPTLVAQARQLGQLIPVAIQYDQRATLAAVLDAENAP